MGRLIYLTGPVRSGKSRRAVDLASAWGSEVVFVATYRPDEYDAEMVERVQRHRLDRPAWRTLEAPANIAQALGDVVPRPSAVVVDCLTLWLSDRLDHTDAELVALWQKQLDQFCAASWPTIVVGNEVGWSPVPESAELRRYRDVAGVLAQRTASAADEAWLMVAGCPVRLK